MSAKTDDPCYKRNFLKQVVARIDLAIPIKNIEKSLNPDFLKTVLKKFPINEPREIIGGELQISAKGIQTGKKHMSKDWLLYSENRDMLLHISEKYAYIEIKDNNYEKYEVFYESFKIFLDSLYKNYDVSVNRFGLRYNNEISFEEFKEDPFDWKDYINKKYLKIFDASPDKKNITRIIQLIEMNYEGSKLRFLYGMPNPDYPAKIRKRMFTLDYDCSTTELMEQNDIEEYFGDFHERIQKLFEESITNKMRDVLNGKYK